MNDLEPARAFERFARATSDDLTADLMRRCGADPTIRALLPAAGWDVPHRLFAAVDWLVDVGRVHGYRDAAEPWVAFRDICFGQSDWIRDFVRRQPVQTNEAQRCFALLPIFLMLSREHELPLDLVELGASAGLNLLWDRYRYRYRAGTWGPAESPLELSGEERGPVPARLLEQQVTIRGRLGIDLQPLDVRNRDDVRLLRMFAARHRHGRLLAAVAAARGDPPMLMRGDYLELLPGILARRAGDGMTVVYQTLSSVYLDDDGRSRLRAMLDAAGALGPPLAYVGTPTPEEHGQRRGDYPIELVTWPGPERRIIARMDNHGEWLDWLG